MQNIESMINFLRIFDGDNIKREELLDKYRFALEDLQIINSMYKHAIIMDSEDGTILLTPTGKFFLFYQNHLRDITNFGNLLKEIGLDTNYLYEYVKYCYQNGDFITIFDINNYEKFLKSKNNDISKMLLLNNRNV